MPKLEKAKAKRKFPCVEDALNVGRNPRSDQKTSGDKILFFDGHESRGQIGSKSESKAGLSAKKSYLIFHRLRTLNDFLKERYFLGGGGNAEQRKFVLPVSGQFKSFLFQPRRTKQGD